MVSGINRVPYRVPEKRIYDLKRGGQRPQNPQQQLRDAAGRPDAEEERTRTNLGDHIDERA
jgi:hypothetical protein